MTKQFTIDELKQFANTCYAHRYHIGKDYFAGMFAMIDLLEIVDIDDLHEYLSNIDIESDRYPL